MFFLSFRNNYCIFQSESVSESIVSVLYRSYLAFDPHTIMILKASLASTSLKPESPETGVNGQRLK